MMTDHERERMRLWQAARRAKLTPEQKELENAKSRHRSRAKSLATLQDRLEARKARAKLSKAKAKARALIYRASHPKPPSTVESREAERLYRKKYRLNQTPEQKALVLLKDKLRRQKRKHILNMK